MKNYICFDIGGTSVKYGILNEDSSILMKDSFPSDALEVGGIGIINNIVTKVNELKNTYELNGVAISTHGMVDSNRGIVLYADDHLIPKYSGLNVKKKVEEETGLVCHIENDVNSAGLGELWNRSDIESENVSMLTVGTGIGSCLIHRGRLISGDSMTSGEIGKIHIDGGVFEDIASTSALCHKIEDRLGLDRGSVNGQMIFEKVEEDDQVYIEELDYMIDKLAVGISTMAYIYNPGTIILGGGIMARSDYFEPRLNLALKKYLNPMILEKTNIVFASLKNDAGMVGALKNFLNRSI